jgi:hypothetical protein
LSVSFGALTVRFDSQVSMAKNDCSVMAANCAGVAGKSPVRQCRQSLR